MRPLVEGIGVVDVEHGNRVYEQQRDGPPATQNPITPTLQPSNPPSLHHSITPSLHHSITPSLHHSITPSLHHSIAPSLHPSIPPSLQPSIPPSLRSSFTPVFEPMNFTPSFHDIAHLAHLELLTPKPDESSAFFTNIVGLHESGRAGESVYLRAWGDYERATLKLTAAKSSGVGHVAFRARNAQVLAHLVENLGSNVVKGTWIDHDISHGPAFRFCDPDGHPIEIYYETERYTATGPFVPGFKNLPQRYVPHGIAPRRLDHVNLLAHTVTS